jgi:hypothetical protein
VSIAACWVLFPIVMLAVATGCGLLVEQAAGLRLSGALVPPVGIALVVAVADFTTTWNATASLTVPLVVALAVLGYGTSFPWRRRLDVWAAAAGLIALAAYAAPIVLSGSATFAGYITLDDTATWLALADQALAHGRAIVDAAPSTYSVVLHDYLGTGYPLGAFALLGIGGKLTAQDFAWVFQPTIAFLGAMLALTIYAGCRSLLRSRLWCAVAAALGAQPALLYAYAYWSGIKEMAAAAMLALVCVLIAETGSRWKEGRPMLPPAIAVAALFAVLSPAGGVWLGIPILVSLVVLARDGTRKLVVRAGFMTALVAALSVPSILIARVFVNGAAGGDITSSSSTANLGHPLDNLQVFGIWPAADFRVQPHNRHAAYVLIAVVVLAAAAGLLLALRRRAWALPLYLGSAVVGFLVLLGFDHIGLSSPWLDAKAMAEASPAIVATAVAGTAAVFEIGHRTAAALACAAIAFGVLWSNELTYLNAWLAPRGQLAELQTIGNRFAGDGPTLMTTFQPYGVRHFLRRMAAEGASERRYRPVMLRGGGELGKGQSADIDQFQLSAVLVYRTLVLRTSPVQSRPPSAYHLVWKGHWYEVWQQDAAPKRILRHVSLGTSLDPTAVPACSRLLRLARTARAAGGELAAAVRPDPPIVVDLSSGSHPSTWFAGADGAIVAPDAGVLTLAADVPSSGRYQLWLGGSFRRTVTVYVDGTETGSATYHLNDAGQWTPLGSIKLAPGRHTVTLRYDGSKLLPGSGGFPFTMGPLVLNRATDYRQVTYVAPKAARSLCGKRLDWVEAVAG